MKREALGSEMAVCFLGMVGQTEESGKKALKGIIVVMRNLHRPAKPGRETTEHDESLPSKSALKAEMTALQALGEKLIELPLERLKRVPMPESLRDAVLDARRFTQREAIRRQRQYVGRLMREVDAEPIAAAVAAFEGESAADTARLHRIEKLREELIADESMLTALVSRHPAANLQRLRQLRRNAIRERNENRPARAFRELFQELKALLAAPAAESGVGAENLQEPIEEPRT